MTSIAKSHAKEGACFSALNDNQSTPLDGALVSPLTPLLTSVFYETVVHDMSASTLVHFYSRHMLWSHP